MDSGMVLQDLERQHGMKKVTNVGPCSQKRL